MAPASLIVNQQPFEGKVSRDTWRNLASHQGGLEWNGTASAHGIEEDLFRCPACESQYPGCQIFPQRCFDGGHPIPTFKQRLAGGVEIECDGALIKKGVELDVRAFCIDAGSPVTRCDELVADCVFDPECQ